MRFQKHVTREAREYLTKQLKEYEQHMTMTKEERKELYEWVVSGRIPYDNGDYLCDGCGYPLDFVSALRTNQELQDWFDSLSEEEKEAERTGTCLIYDTRTEDIYSDITTFKLPDIEDEELPFS